MTAKKPARVTDKVLDAYRRWWKTPQMSAEDTMRFNEATFRAGYKAGYKAAISAERRKK